MNRRVDIREDIKHYQDTLSYASRKVDYSVEENVFMLPSNMNLNIVSGTMGYNNKILISDGTLSLGKNDKINTLELGKEGDKPKISPKVLAQPSLMKTQHRKKLSPTKRKSCFDTFSGRRFCNIPYVSVIMSILTVVLKSISYFTSRPHDSRLRLIFNFSDNIPRIPSRC